MVRVETVPQNRPKKWEIMPDGRPPTDVDLGELMPSMTPTEFKEWIRKENAKRLAEEETLPQQED